MTALAGSVRDGAVWARMCSANGTISMVRIDGDDDGAPAPAACHAPGAVLRDPKRVAR